MKFGIMARGRALVRALVRWSALGRVLGAGARGRSGEEEDVPVFLESEGSRWRVGLAIGSFDFLHPN